MSNCSTQLSANLPIGKHQAAHLSDTLANNGSDNQCKNGDHLLSFSEKLACTLYSLTQQQQSNPPLINQPTQQLNPNNSPAATSCSLFHHNNLSPTASNMHPNHNRKLSILDCFLIGFSCISLDGMIRPGLHQIIGSIII